MFYFSTLLFFYPIIWKLKQNLPVLIVKSLHFCYHPLRILQKCGFLYPNTPDNTYQLILCSQTHLTFDHGSARYSLNKNECSFYYHPQL